MDLKIKDVAELLNVSISTIRRWLHDGKIPAYRLNNHYRFSRQEIERWVMQQKMSPLSEAAVFTPSLLEQVAPSIEAEEELLEERETARRGMQQFSLYRAMHRGGVYSHVAVRTKVEAIRYATHLLGQKFNLDADVLTDLLLDRERLMATGLGQGLAVPHTRDFLLDKHFDIVTVIFPEQPIEYEALDGQPVHALFFLFACDGKRHLHLLAKLAHLCRDPEALTLLQQCPSREELLLFIQAWEAKIASLQNHEAK